MILDFGIWILDWNFGMLMIRRSFGHKIQILNSKIKLIRWLKFYGYNSREFQRAGVYVS